MMEGFELDAELKDEEGDGSGEVDGREEDEFDVSSNRPLQPHALGAASPSRIPTSRAAGLRSQCFSENIGVSENAQ